MFHSYRGKKIPVALFSILVILMICIVSTGCGADGEMTDDDLDYIMNEEVEDNTNVDPSKAAEAEALNKDEKNFIGSWSATSEEARNLYGNLEITINADGTFDADVTGEVFSGTWTMGDSGISYESELMKGNIFYGNHGRLVIEDVDNGNIRLVLNRKD